jgi:S-adenosylmethionine:tRNA ribosyltransferase-isomerase
MRFSVPETLEAREPPEARGISRDGVRLMVSSPRGIEHHRFTDLPSQLAAGDLLVVNTSRTIPAAVRAVRGGPEVHFSGQLPDGAWLAEFRLASGKTSVPNDEFAAPTAIELPGGATLTVDERFAGRLWKVRMSTPVLPYLASHGFPIRYSYAAAGQWPLAAYQTVFGTDPGSAEMPSAARPFTPPVVTALVNRGVTIARITLHCGVSSLEAGEDPYPERYVVPESTSRLVSLVRRSGGRVIAAGTTVVRALETTGGAAGSGWTSHVVTPQTGVRVVDGLLTGLHEPEASHLRMLAAFHDPELLARCYDEALDRRYLWHEFGDVHLLLS